MMSSLKWNHSSNSNDTTLVLKSLAKEQPSLVGTVGSTNGMIGLNQEGLVADQSMYYYYSGYHYPGYGWNEPAYMAGANGSLVYYMPEFQSGYNSYPTSLQPESGAMVVDEKHLRQQQCITTPIALQAQTLGTSVYYPSSLGHAPEVMPAYREDTFFWNFNNEKGYMGDLAMSTTKPKYLSQMRSSKATTDSKRSFVEAKRQRPILKLPQRVSDANPPVNLLNKTSEELLPVAKLPSCSDQGGDERNSVDTDLLNEQSPDSTTDALIKTSTSESRRASISIPDLESGNYGSKTAIFRRDDYNLSDFPTNYDQASFFVIKSYSEDDIHKSIKYNVWASTLNGNKILDSAFQTAEEKMMKEEGNNHHPIFLFFSVNASGQFCGVAEMIGRVDFNKNMGFWQQDKWNGFFPVKWHIIKDVPNPQLRHIKLENNDYKPVTNSRDTQEVKLTQGSEMLNIFKAFSNKTSILDDFGFYEKRQKVMQDKRTKICASPKNLPKEDEEAKEPDKVEPLIASALGCLELSPVKSLEPVQ